MLGWKSRSRVRLGGTTEHDNVIKRACYMKNIFEPEQLLTAGR